MKGTTPAGTVGEREAARWVRTMFARVAPRYDLCNHLLSFQIDRYWRALTVRRVEHILRRPGARVLDLCCGTGDLQRALQLHSPNPVWGSDFCRPMLDAAAAKVGRAWLFESDALELPVADASLDLITIAFGFRNLANYERGLQEIRRALRPSGVAAILEFSQPPNRGFASLYNFYSRRILPLIAGALSGAREAYTYLPDSVRKFPSAGELAEQMRNAGFRDVRFERMTFGIVALHLGTV